MVKEIQAKNLPTTAKQMVLEYSRIRSSEALTAWYPKGTRRWT